MLGTFSYLRIAQPMIDDCVRHFQKGNSIVVLGPPGSGKSIVRKQLQQALLRTPEGIETVVASFDPNRLPLTLEDARDYLSALIDPSALPLNPSSRGRRRVVMCLPNLHIIPRGIALVLLAELLAAPPQPTPALVTGTDELLALLIALRPTHHPSVKIVIQGFDRKTFDDRILAFRHGTGITVPEVVKEHLFALTNGMGDQVNAILHLLTEHRVLSEIGNNQHVTLSEVDACLQRATDISNPESFVLRQAIELLPTHRASWDNLGRMLRGQPAVLRHPTGPPGALTLSGLAIRKAGVLLFSSPLMESCARSYFTGRRLAELSAQAGAFQEAFRLLRTTSSSSRARSRPVTRNDQRGLTLSIQSSCAHIHSLAMLGRKEVCDFFSDVCRTILDFPTLALFQKDKTWKPLPHTTLTEEEAALATEVTEAESLPEREFWLPQSFDGRLVAFASPVEHIQDPGSSQGNTINTRRGGLLILVGNLESGEELLLDYRLSPLRQLIDHFCEAYFEALSLETDRDRLDFRSSQSEVLTTVLHAIGQHLFDQRRAFERVGRDLRSLGYGRIAFALVDSRQQAIVPLLDESDTPLLEFGPWSVLGPIKNVHQWVYMTKEPLRVPIAAKHPLATPEAVAKGRIEAFALLPMLDPDEEVVGTLHIERSDKTLPSEGEVADFMALGRQLAALVQHARRLEALQGALDKLADPLIITDPVGAPLYVNLKASQSLGIGHGWRGRKSEQMADQIKLSVLVDGLSKVFGGTRIGRLISPGSGLPEALTGGAAYATADQLNSATAGLLGAFIQIEDFGQEWKTFRALGTIAKADSHEDLLKRLLDAIGELGHQWARLYLLNPKNGSLESRMQFGLTDDSIVREFAEGRYVLQKEAGQGEESWLCITRQEAVLFAFKGSDTAGWTKEGVPYVGTAYPCFGALKKRLGEFWIDAPLLVGDDVIGKITIQATEDTHPKALKFLDALIRVAARLFDALESRRQRMATEITHATNKAREHSLATLSHSLATQVTGFSILPDLYRQFEDVAPTIKPINVMFAENYEAIRKGLERAKEAFTLAPPKLERANMVKTILSVAQGLLSPDSYEYRGPSEYMADYDEHLFAKCLQELLLNANSIVPNVTIRLSLESRPRTTNNMNSELMRLEVADNGPGIPLEEKESVFEWFVKSRDRDDGVNSGLGLAIVRDVIQKHRGTIREIGTPGSGAVFALEMPRWKDTGGQPDV